MKGSVGIAVVELLLSVSCVLLGGPHPGGSDLRNVTPVTHGASRHLEASSLPSTLIGLQYETYFTPLNTNWGGNDGTALSGLQRGTEEAIPILGKYSSFDVKVLLKHEEWFEDMSINWLLLDWSNMLWMKPAWEEHRGATHELEESTNLLFKIYSELQKEGRRPPKLVIMLGLQNGPPVVRAMQRLNGIIAWTTKSFFDKPEYKNLWLYYHGKPLMTILYFPANPCKELKRVLRQTPLIAPDWTIRWMASQLQDNHAERCGMWSWMDGTIRQAVTYRNGTAEETVVTPSSFPLVASPDGGWLSPKAVGRDHGTPYLESWKVAFASRPKFIQIHQWNEFAGQGKGEGAGPRHNLYGDEYSPELSDDIEPTQLDGCGYRGCGGWGYYYMNLTKALISLYRQETPDITVMALSGPVQPAVVKKNHLSLKWITIGKQPRDYTVFLDGRTVAHNIVGQKYVLDLAHVRPGRHHVTLVAKGVHTYFDLDPKKMTTRSAKPLPVVSTVDFTTTLGGDISKGSEENQ